MAPDVRQLIFGRAIQGAALLVPGSLAIISASFEKSRRGPRYWDMVRIHIDYSLRGTGSGRFPDRACHLALGLPHQPSGGVCCSGSDAVAGTRKPYNVQPGMQLDWLGASLGTLGLCGIVYALIESSKDGWTARPVIVALTAGFGALVAFIAVETSNRSPLLPLRRFRSMDFGAVNLITLFLYSALSILFFFFPLDLIQVQGYSATAAGAATLPFIFFDVFALTVVWRTR